MSPTVPALSPERHAQSLKSLAEQEFDVLVVGGGIVGGGAALDAATRGLRVAIVEAQDWASGTSSRSSKLIHGGLRYLEMHDFALVREALHERAVLQQTAPHLVHPLRFLYPLRRGLRERLYVGAGVLLYDLLARGGERAERYPFHRQLSRRSALRLAPALSGGALTGAVQYFDGQVDDARHTFAVVRTAVANGAIALSRVRALGVLRAGGRVVGARLRNEEDGEELETRARVVIGATGAWTARFAALAGHGSELAVQPSKGVHLVVPKTAIDSSTALILPTDRSVLFVLPWGEHWIIGTTDTPWEHDVGRPAASATDVEYLLSTLNSVLERPLARRDIESVYVGVRPLIGHSDETTRLSREHAVSRPEPGLVLVSGGKYTTYRVMARDVVDAAVAEGALAATPCITASVPIAGGEGFLAAGARVAALASSLGLGESQAERLLGRYGALAEEVLELAATDSPLRVPLASGYLRAEVAYAVRFEDARHLEDVLARRTRMALETAGRGVDDGAAVASVMAPLLGWSAEHAGAEITAYTSAVEAALDAESSEGDAAAARATLNAVPLLPAP